MDLNQLGMNYYIQQDEQSFSKLYLPLRKKIIRDLYMYNIVSVDRDLLADRIVDHIYFKINSYNPLYTFVTFAIMITNNFVFKYFNSKKNNIPFDEVNFSFDLKPIDEYDYDAKLFELIEIIEEPYKSIIIRKYYGREKWEDLADEFGENLSTLKTKIKLRIKRLKEYYEITRTKDIFD